MKTFQKKLTLNKEIIANLDLASMDRVKGGIWMTVDDNLCNDDILQELDKFDR